MRDCIFCKIVRGEVPSIKIAEDSRHVAFPDKFPIVDGQAVVITKKHYGSYQFKMPEKAYADLMRFSRKVGLKIDRRLGSKRCFMVVEGMLVPHVHVKLYPVYKVRPHKPPVAPKKFVKGWYSGSISTMLGPERTMRELEKVAKKLK